VNAAARLARLDQDRALINETVNELVADVREVLADADAAEVLLALIASFDDSLPGHVSIVAAGALLQLAQEEDR
jgi:hypothetical protein